MKKGQPRIEHLIQDPRYQLVEVLGFDEMVPFVFKHIRQKGFMSFAYFISIFLLLAYVVIHTGIVLAAHSLSGRQILTQGFAGIITGSFLVIPVHELIHGLSYLILGARRVIFGADLKQFIFYVTADKYPISGMRVIFLALFPFAIVNAVTFIIILNFFPETMIFGGVFLLSHNIMCIGDFAICNYVLRTGNRIYTFDVPEEKKTYFYERKRDY
jgi:hypothetical protein